MKCLEPCLVHSSAQLNISKILATESSAATRISYQVTLDVNPTLSSQKDDTIPRIGTVLKVLILEAIFLSPFPDEHTTRNETAR